VNEVDVAHRKPSTTPTAHCGSQLNHRQAYTNYTQGIALSVITRQHISKTNSRLAILAACLTVTVFRIKEALTKPALMKPQSDQRRQEPSPPSRITMSAAAHLQGWTARMSNRKRNINFLGHPWQGQQLQTNRNMLPPAQPPLPQQCA
jgi:hypothetical protein